MPFPIAQVLCGDHTCIAMHGLWSY